METLSRIKDVAIPFRTIGVLVSAISWSVEHGVEVFYGLGAFVASAALYNFYRQRPRLGVVETYSHIKITKKHFDEEPFPFINSKRYLQKLSNFIKNKEYCKNILLVCGGKEIGKSTGIIYMIATEWNTNQYFVLDFDLRQSSYTSFDSFVVSLQRTVEECFKQSKMKISVGDISRILERFSPKPTTANVYMNLLKALPKELSLLSFFSSIFNLLISYNRPTKIDEIHGEINIFNAMAIAIHLLALVMEHTNTIPILILRNIESVNHWAGGKQSVELMLESLTSFKEGFLRVPVILETSDSSLGNRMYSKQSRTSILPIVCEAWDDEEIQQLAVQQLFTQEEVNFLKPYFAGFPGLWRKAFSLKHSFGVSVQDIANFFNNNAFHFYRNLVDHHKEERIELFAFLDQLATEQQVPYTTELDSKEYIKTLMSHDVTFLRGPSYVAYATFYLLTWKTLRANDSYFKNE